VEAVFSVLSLREQIAPPTINIFNQIRVRTWIMLPTSRGKSGST
jgi:3-oxoacyl-(acyl-carrier-protein) synthase